MNKHKSIIPGLLLVLLLSIAAGAAIFSTEQATMVTPQIDTDGKEGYFLIQTALPKESKTDNAAITVTSENGDIYLVHTALQQNKNTASQNNSDKDLIVAGRFQKAGPASVTVRARTADGKIQTLTRLNFELSNVPTAAPQVRSRWASLQQNALRYSDPEGKDPFTQYWNLAIAPRYKLADMAHFNRNRQRQEPPNLYSIFTGAAAIQETLQLEVLTGTDRGDENRHTGANVPISTLQGPTVKSHPFKEMLKGRVPDVPKLAKLIPENQYAVFFSDINKQIELEELMEEWGGNLLHQTAASAQDFKVRTKFNRQLCLSGSLLTKWFGDKVIAEMAFTGQDPFLKEGTGLTVLFSLKNEKRFKKQIESGYSEAASRFGAVPFEKVIDGKLVKGVQTPDQRISSYVVFIDEYAAVSNTLNGIQNILDASAGRAPVLAKADDFRYMRTIFLQNAAEEDIFIYLSDAHIRHLVSPRAKIGEARRMRCSANMDLLANARLWFVAEKRREPTFKELSEGGYLGASVPTCPDHGKYDFEKSGRPACSLHNQTGLLTPVEEIRLDHVTAAEAEQYRSFVNNYNRYWTKFFDPIGIRVKMGKDIRVQTVILPLIENSWYDGFAAFAGRTPGRLTEHLLLPRTVISLRGNLAEDWFSNSGLSEGLSEKMGLKLDWLGNEVSLNLMDSHVLFSAGSGAVSMIGRDLGRRPTETLFISYLLSALNMPTYMAVKVTDPVKAEKSIPAIFRAMAGKNRNSGDFSVETYTIEDHRGKPVYVANFNIWLLKLRLFSAVIDDRFVTASRKEIITDLIDANQGSSYKKPVANDGSMELSVYRSAFKDFAEHVNIGWQEELRHACHNNLPLASVLMSGLGVTQERLNSSIEHLRGYDHYCPSGGKYSIIPGTRAVTCSVHGTTWKPRQPAASPADSKTIQLLNSIEKINARMAFTPEGLMTTVEIKRKK
jgi:hypothetical protein